jgi:geranylgeranyl diphosphate synthase type II
MDDDDFRRGKPSLHRAFSEEHAVLAGDFLLTHSFLVLAQAPHLNPEQKIQLVEILASKGGGSGMIAGQILDIESQASDISSLKEMHQRKTGALLTAAVEFGCIAANGSQSDRAALRLFGEEIGLAFQVMDDVLDVTASVQKHGSANSSDALNGKTTFATLLGLDKAREHASDLLASAYRRLDSLPCDTSLLKALAAYMIKV